MRVQRGGRKVRGCPATGLLRSRCFSGSTHKPAAWLGIVDKVWNREGGALAGKKRQRAGRLGRGEIVREYCSTARYERECALTRAARETVGGGLAALEKNATRVGGPQGRGSKKGCGIVRNCSGSTCGVGLAAPGLAHTTAATTRMRNTGEGPGMRSFIPAWQGYRLVEGGTSLKSMGWQCGNMLIRMGLLHHIIWPAAGARSGQSCCGAVSTGCPAAAARTAAAAAMLLGEAVAASSPPLWLRPFGSPPWLVWTMTWRILSPARMPFMACRARSAAPASAKLTKLRQEGQGGGTAVGWM